MDVVTALSKAILDEPDDDLPRLAYADWLEERGGEADVARAEFIRAQIEQARNPNEYRPAAILAAVILWPRYRTRWFGPAAERMPFSDLSRGFLTGVTLGTFVGLVEEAKRTEEAWPLGPVPLVRIGGRVWEGFDEGVSLARVARLHGLASWGGIDCRTGTGELLRSPHLVNLRALWLTSNLTGRSDLDALPRAAFRLRSLRFSGRKVSDGALRLVAGEPALNELREFTLEASPGTQAPVVELFGSTNVARLERLTLRGPGGWNQDWAKKATLRALLYSSHLTNLRSLALGSNRELLSKTGARELARWKGLARLESLALRDDVGLSNEGLHCLAQSPHLSNLRELALYCPRLDPLALTQSPHLGGLRRLVVGGPALTEPAKAALVAHFGDRVTFDAS